MARCRARLKAFSRLVVSFANFFVATKSACAAKGGSLSAADATFTGGWNLSALRERPPSAIARRRLLAFVGRDAQHALST